MKFSRSLAVPLILIVLGTMLFTSVAYGATSPDWPLEVTVDGVDYRFATHGGSQTEGGWIELSGGVSLTLPTITCEYTGISSADYDIGGQVVIGTDPSFINDDLIYPFATHQLYSHGDTITYEFKGKTSFTGDSISVRLIELTSPNDWEDAITAMYNGDDNQIQTLLNTFIQADGPTVLANGDFPGTFTTVSAGDYLIVAMDNSAGTVWEIYGGTLVTVLEGDLAATVPAEVREGNDLDVEMTLTGGNTPGMAYGVVMMKESAFEADVLFTGGSSSDDTSITINGATFIEATASVWEVFGGGIDNLNKDYLMDFMGDAFASNEYAIAFSSTSATSQTVSVTTNDLTEGDYHVFSLVYDSNGDMDSGKRIIGIDEGTVFVDYVSSGGSYTPPPSGGGIVVPPTVDEIEEQTPEDAAEILGGLDPDAAADIVEELDVESAVEIIGELSSETAADIIDAVNETSATAIVEELAPETVVDIIVEAEPETVAKVLESVTVEQAADIVEAAFEPDALDTITTVMNEVGAEEAADILLEVEPSQGAIVVTGMAEKNINAAAIRVEEAVKKKLGESDPEKAEEILAKIAATLDSMDVGALVGIFTEIANLPDTPSTVATVLAVWAPEKVQEVIGLWMDTGAYNELAAVFSYFTEDFMAATYPAISPENREALYPYLSAATVGMLPQLGEFTAELELSASTVEPGEGVTVTVVISNIGDEADSTTVGLFLDGSEIDSEIVYLAPEASTTLTWTVSEDTEGTYSVEVLGESESFTVEAPLVPAEFSLSALQVSPSIVEPDVDVTVTFTVSNTGDLTGDYRVEVELDGSVVDVKTGTLAGGGAQMLTSNVSADEAGTHTVSVDGLEAEFGVEEVEGPPSGFPIMYIAVGLIVIVAAGYFYMQSQKE